MKRNFVLACVLMLLVGLYGVASAYTIDYSYIASGNEYTSPKAGSPGSTTFDFNGGALPSGWSGDGMIVTGSVSGKYSAPMGIDGINKDVTAYLTVPVDTVNPNVFYATFTSEYNYLGLWWGSVDTYNVLSFYNNNVLVETITGSQAINPSSANGNQTAPSTNLYVNIYSLPSFDEFRMTSNQYAFEVDNITVGVPEPTTLLLLGFGLLGLVGIRRKSIL